MEPPQGCERGKQRIVPPRRVEGECLEEGSHIFADVPILLDRGVVDFRAIMPILAAANPDLNLSIENYESFSDRPRNPPKLIIEIADPKWLESHPDLSVEEYADYMKMVQDYAARIASGEVMDRESFAAWAAKNYHYAETVDYIKKSAAHVRGICEELGLPLSTA